MHDFEPKANSKKTPPRQSTIHQWLSLRMSLVVVATVLVGGTIAGLLILNQINDQIRSRLESARFSTLALYEAEKSSLLKVAQLVAVRPSLCSLLQLEDKPKLDAYLEELRINTPADFLMVIDANGNVFSSSVPPFPLLEIFLIKSPAPFVDLTIWGDAYSPTLYSISEVTPPSDCPLPFYAQIIALQFLDGDFLEKLAGDTGVEQSLIVGDRFYASSLPQGDWFEEPARLGATGSSKKRTVCRNLPACREEPYYIDHAVLKDAQGEVVATLEIAFPGGDIRNRMTSSILILLGTVILVALASVLISQRLTRQVWSSLRVLSEAAERMGAGDLETPIPISSGWVSVDRLANQLEHSRKNLQQIQSITRRNLVRFVHLLGAIREGMVTINLDGLITWTNQDACTILGYENLRMILNKDSSEIFRQAPGEITNIKDILSPTKDKQTPTILSILNATGEKITLSITLSSMETGKGKPAENIHEHVLVIREISEEQAFTRMQTEFLANIAHEFRTPLSTISAATELLVEEGQEMSLQELEDLNHSIRMGVVHLQTLVDNLLEQATIEAGVFKLRMKLLNIPEILSKVKELVSPLLNRRQQHLVIKTEGRISPVSGDPVRLVQALVNLVQNASKFSPSSSDILVLAAKDGDMIKFSVSDSGIGLPVERYEKLFDRFFSRDRMQGSQYGIGLGLPIVKTIAEAHGGKVGAVNLPGKGAKVWFSISTKNDNYEGDIT